MADRARGRAGDTSNRGPGAGTIWAAVALVAIAAIVLIVWLKRDPTPDCAFTGWQRSVGVDLEAQVKRLDVLKAKLAISDRLVRDFDAFLKDYAVKYDAACQDRQAGRISAEEYLCLRRNFDQVLDQLRAFTQSLEAIKSLTDPAMQRDNVVNAIDALRAASASRFRQGCASAMDVNPKTLEFAGMTPVLVVRLSNRGNNDLIYTVDGLPSSFLSDPTSGRLSRGATTPVVITRTIQPVPAIRPIRFYIRTNFEDAIEIQITVDAAAGLWKKLGEQTLKLASTRGGSPAVDDALQVVASATEPTTTAISQPTKYLLASTILYELRADAAAESALKVVTASGSDVGKHPSTMLMSGLLASRHRNPKVALTYFAGAKASAGADDTFTRYSADLYSGLVLIDLGESASTQLVFRDTGAKLFLADNPAVTSFALKELCTRDPCRVAVASTIVAAKP